MIVMMDRWVNQMIMTSDDDFHEAMIQWDYQTDPGFHEDQEQERDFPWYRMPSHYRHYVIDVWRKEGGDRGRWLYRRAAPNLSPYVALQANKEGRWIQIDDIQYEILLIRSELLQIQPEEFTPLLSDMITSLDRLKGAGVLEWRYKPFLLTDKAPDMWFTLLKDNEGSRRFILTAGPSTVDLVGLANRDGAELEVAVYADVKKLRTLGFDPVNDVTYEPAMNK